MIIIQPKYYDKFKCIGSKCNDNCCIGWEIDIDDKTAEYYRNIKGDFGKRLCENIEFSANSHFIMDSNLRCPFLNKNNLCDIFIELGKENLCQICTEHPRFYSNINNIMERGLGLCCEEVCRLLLTNNDFGFIGLDELSKNESFSFDDDLYVYCFYNIRNNIFTEIRNYKICFKLRLINIFDYALNVQRALENSNFDELLELSKGINSNKNNLLYNTSIENLENLLDFYLNLEINEDSWAEKIINIKQNLSSILNKCKLMDTDFSGFNEYEKLLEYFVFRYFMKEQFQYNALEPICFGIMSYTIIKLLNTSEFIETGNLRIESIIDNIKNYSKEIEYCPENIQEIYKKFACLSLEDIYKFILGILI